MSKPRDMQRAKVYQAEAVLDKMGEQNLTLEAIEKLVMAVRCNPALRRRYETALSTPIKVTDGRARRRAGANTREIKMPKWSRFTSCVLHEVAHTITRRTLWVDPVAGHGYQWCSVYIDLVHFIMGKEAADALKASFRKYKVRWTPKKKARPMSDEQKQALRERLEQARVAKRQAEQQATGWTIVARGLTEVPA